MNKVMQQTATYVEEADNCLLASLFVSGSSLSVTWRKLRQFIIGLCRIIFIRNGLEVFVLAEQGDSL